MIVEPIPVSPAWRRLRLARRLGSLALLALLAACSDQGERVEITKTREVGPDDPWKAPKGWVRGPERNMRMVTYSPGGRADTECYVTVLSRRAGGEVENLNRWREQMGQPALSTEEIAALPTVTVLGEPCRLLEVAGSFTDLAGARREGILLLGVVRMLPEQVYTLKMTGPEDVVRGEKANFISFCESLR